MDSSCNELHTMSSLLYFPFILYTSHTFTLDIYSTIIDDAPRQRAGGILVTTIYYELLLQIKDNASITHETT